jgi:hypothetical protein
MNRTEMRPHAARSRGGETAMLLGRQPATTLEDHHQLDHFGEEASPPSDGNGRVPADEDQHAPEEMTPAQLAAGEAGDLEFSEEGTEQ